MSMSAEIAIAVPSMLIVFWMSDAKKCLIMNLPLRL
jgi:hypothetical protein